MNERLNPYEYAVVPTPGLKEAITSAQLEVVWQFIQDIRVVNIENLGDTSTPRNHLLAIWQRGLLGHLRRYETDEVKARTLADLLLRMVERGYLRVLPKENGMAMEWPNRRNLKITKEKTYKLHFEPSGKIEWSELEEKIIKGITTSSRADLEEVAAHINENYQTVRNYLSFIKQKMLDYFGIEKEDLEGKIELAWVIKALIISGEVKVVGKKS